jgi:hypothetical protein
VVACVVNVRHVLAEDLLALFAGKDHFRGLCKLVLLRLHVALGAIEPLLAARRPDGHL